MNPITRKYLCLLAGTFILAILLPASLVAQDIDEDNADADAEPANVIADFNLFEPVDSVGNPEQIRTRGRSRVPGDSSEPEFTLVGTTRIGDRYTAILRNRNGTEVVVSTKPQTNTRIEGYSEYSVVNVGAGNVSIQYPDSSTCIENTVQGVSCNTAANIASLALTNGAPLPRTASQRGSARSNQRDLDRLRAAAENANNPTDSDENLDGEVVVSDENPEEPVNPFAALRARAQANDNDGATAGGRASTRQGFTPRRIDPNDVPPGMRVVSTPFGDRLVED